jgi:hypothetical protein
MSNLMRCEIAVYTICVPGEAITEAVRPHEKAAAGLLRSAMALTHPDGHSRYPQFSDARPGWLKNGTTACRHRLSRLACAAIRCPWLGCVHHRFSLRSVNPNRWRLAQQ